MRLLATLILVLTVSFATAQENITSPQKDINTEVFSNLDTEKDLVISGKGFRTIKSIGVQNYNKTVIITLMSEIKRKSKLC